MRLDAKFNSERRYNFIFSVMLQMVQLTWKAFAIEVNSSRMGPIYTFETRVYKPHLLTKFIFKKKL